LSALDKQLDSYLRQHPKLGRGVYIATGAVVVGDVTLGARSSVWYNAVLRGDINRIVVGSSTNLQDNSVVHLADDLPCLLGDYVTVGHSAILHACTVKDEVLVGMGSVILDGAIIGSQCLIGARTLITEGTEIPVGSLVVGTPGRVVRALNPVERSEIKALALKYVRAAAYCLKHKINVSAPLPS
jgi:gamma-carbonic anhydrase